MMKHSALCKKTAQWASKKAKVVLWEYQSFATNEFPDVLSFDGYSSTIYEIKVSRSDFRADAGKQARVRWKPKTAWYYGGRTRTLEGELYLQAERPELYYIEAPHLGAFRYYVAEFFTREDAMSHPRGWGFIRFSGSRFHVLRESAKFRRNLFEENSILTHALRAAMHGSRSNIIVKPYLRPVAEEDKRQ